MNKWATLQGFSKHDGWGKSGLYPKHSEGPIDVLPETAARNDGESTGQSVGELWQAVAYWIERMDPADPRRRLLELARLRYDASLASTVLRHL